MSPETPIIKVPEGHGNQRPPVFLEYISNYRDDGDTITSCVVISTQVVEAERAPKLTENQQTVFSILHEAGQGGLELEQYLS